MQLKGKPLEAINWQDLVTLVEANVAESPVLDYKALLPASNDAGKKELLADISAMANTSGGVILYGITEARDEEDGKTDRPESLVGLAGTNAAHEQQRLEQVIRSGLDPPLARFLVRPIFNADRSTYVMAIGVVSSMLAPHAVATATTMPFWRRAGSSRFALRTSELRHTFLERGAWEEEAEQFRSKRIVAQRSAPAEHPFSKLTGTSAFLLHVLPLGRLRDWIDLIPHWELLKQKLTFGRSLHEGRLNFEGILRSQHQYDGKLTRYVQWFRCGGVEAFTSSIEGRSPIGPHKPTVDVTRSSIFAVEYAMEAMLILDRTFRVPPPYGVLLTMLNVRGRQVEMIREQQANFTSYDPYHDITEDDLLFPAVLFEEAHENVQAVAAAMQPALDALWQAGGIGRCRDYKDGVWVGRTLLGWEELL